MTFTLKKGVLIGALLSLGASTLFGQRSNCDNNAAGIITVGSSCNPVAWNVANNSDYWDGAAGCGGTDLDDVWGRFQATSTSTTITYTPVAGTDAIVHIFGPNPACAVNMPSLACSNTGGNGVAETIVQATTVGAWYRVRVQRSGSNTTMNGTICVYSPLINDLCANATTLNCGSTLTGQTSVGASNIAHGTGCTMGNYGVWYTFTGDGNISTISSTADAGWNHEMAIVSGSCGSTANVACVDNVAAGGTETYTFTTVNGLNYLIYIACDWSGTVAGCSSGFDISRTCTVPPPAPANDLCANATTLNCGDNLIGETTVGATNVAHGTGCTMGNYGVWYTFVGDGNNSTITSDAAAGFNHEMAIVSGSCGSFTNVACVDNNGMGGIETYTFTTTNLVNYYVYIAFDPSGNYPNATSAFDISRTCAVPPPAPPNDLCPNATTLNCGDNLIGETTVGATNVSHGTGCLMNDYGVWYTFVGDGNQSTISVDPDAGCRHQRDLRLPH
jgi:hypothetical protein